MAESTFARFWNAVKPPAAVRGPHAPPARRMRREQRRLLIITSSVVLAGLAGWAVYAYMGSAPQRAQHQYDAAQQFMVPGNFGKAIAAYTRAIQIQPRMAEAYLARGVAYHWAGDDEKALADFSQAIDLDPNLAGAYAARGAIARSRGQVDKAFDELERSLKARPNLDAFYERGQLYESLGQHVKAIADYDQAISFERDAPHIYRARAFSKSNLGDEEGATADRREASLLEHH